ncbi:Rieske domain-containing protein-like [Hydractinia symbiolongicarpus]|uniref:Rieske domain-containing protein-like n=1 Tax=Hydractinia symbiolongicarpus TaxID=13093 RepID=UPI00254CBF33|nr:Rieske domain-containing protein-like [Hydractinia symbiolongicarpus]
MDVPDKDRPLRKDRTQIKIVFEKEMQNDVTPTKLIDESMPNYAMLHAKKAIAFGGMSRENSFDNLIEEKHKKDLFFSVDKVKFEDLYDWGNRTSESNKPKTGTSVVCNRTKIALFRYDREVFAIDEKCPHMGGPLHLGDIEVLGEASILCVVCPWHKWRLELTSGRLKMPSGRGIHNNVYPTRVSPDGRIMIGFSEISPELFSGDDDDF